MRGWDCSQTVGGFGVVEAVHCVDLHMFEALLGSYEATKSPRYGKKLIRSSQAFRESLTTS